MQDGFSIIDALREGKTPEELSKIFTENLNSAVKQLDKENEENKAAAIKAAKRDKIKVIIDNLKDYFLSFYGDKEGIKTLVASCSEEDLDEYIAAIDELINFYSYFPTILDSYFKVPNTPKKKEFTDDFIRFEDLVSNFVKPN